MKKTGASSGPVHRFRRGGVHRRGPGEDHGVPYRKASRHQLAFLPTDRGCPPGWSTITTPTAWTNFGPFFVTFCSHCPCNARLCFNGNHWAQHQAAKAGIGFTPLDNAFAQVDDPAGLQQICDRLGTEQINALLDKWLALLPNPPAQQDRDAGYR